MAEIDEIVIPEVTYLAVFDPETGSVLSVGPYNALKDNKNIIDIDNDLVERIHSGEVKIHSCFIDLDSEEISIAEAKHVFTIDDVLHRIPLAKDCDVENPDIVIQMQSNKLKIQLSEKWGGNYPYKNKKADFRARKTVWSGDTVCEFLITKPNDPNIIYDYFKCYLEDIQKDYEYDLTKVKNECSIYTKRILKSYVLETV